MSSYFVDAMKFPGVGGSTGPDDEVTDARKDYFYDYGVMSPYDGGCGGGGGGSKASLPTLHHTSNDCCPVSVRGSMSRCYPRPDCRSAGAGKASDMTGVASAGLGSAMSGGSLYGRNQSPPSLSNAPGIHHPQHQQQQHRSHHQPPQQPEMNGTSPHHRQHQ